jgi:hypothetical protein
MNMIPDDLKIAFQELEKLFLESAEALGTIEQVAGSMISDLNIFHHSQITWYDWETKTSTKYKDYRFFYKFYQNKDGLIVMDLKMTHPTLDDYHWTSMVELGWNEVF